MPLGEPIKLRLKPETEQRVTYEAQARGIAVTAVLREKVEQAMDMAGQVAEFRRELDAGFYDLRERQEDFSELLQIKSTAHEDGYNISAIYEIILLLRSIAGTERLSNAHREMKKLGLTPFNPDNK